MEPGDFISSIYLYVSLVLVSGNCIFNPLNRFNPLSTNFFFPFALMSAFVTLQLCRSIPGQKSDKQRGFWRSCGQGSAPSRIPGSSSASAFPSASFLRKAVDNSSHGKCFNGIQCCWELYSRE